MKEMEEDLINLQAMALAELEELEMEQDLTNFQEMAIAEQQEEDSLYLIPTVNTDAVDINELLFGYDWLHLNVVVDKEHSKSCEEEPNPDLKSIILIDGIHDFESDLDVNTSTHHKTEKQYQDSLRAEYHSMFCKIQILFYKCEKDTIPQSECDKANLVEPTMKETILDETKDQPDEAILKNFSQLDKNDV